MVEILKNMNKPIKKTHLLYRIGGLNFQELNRYLDQMSSAGLLNATEEPSKQYYITDRGKTVLDIFASHT
jgi:predicted transcriptional regulator